MYIIKYFKNNLNIGYKSIIIILKKAPTPKVDAPKRLCYALTDTAHPVDQTGWAIKLPKDISNVVNSYSVFPFYIRTVMRVHFTISL